MYSLLLVCIGQLLEEDLNSSLNHFEELKLDKTYLLLKAIDLYYYFGYFGYIWLQCMM